MGRVKTDQAENLLEDEEEDEKENEKEKKTRTESTVQPKL